VLGRIATKLAETSVPIGYFTSTPRWLRWARNTQLSNHAIWTHRNWRQGASKTRRK